MDVFIKGAKAQVLEQIAYIDSLTGTANRRQCEKKAAMKLTKNNIENINF